MKRRSLLPLTLTILVSLVLGCVPASRARGLPLDSSPRLAGGGAGENEILTFFQLPADNSATVVIAFLEKLADK